MSSKTNPRKQPQTYPSSLTNLNRFSKTVHGHDGSSRIVMVRKTDQRTFASYENGGSPKLETVTRETIETFRGQKTECKFTTEKKNFENNIPQDLKETIAEKFEKVKTPLRKQPRKNTMNDFQSESLRAHNKYREKHCVPPLKLNKEMCRISQKHADYLINKRILEHSNNGDYGENIFAITSTNPNFTISGEEPVDSWYSEINKHRFGEEPRLLSTGHFTQVVWKETKELGIAFAKKGGKIVVVANYSPSGNILGQFSENVPPLGGFQEEINGNSLRLSDSMGKLSVKSVGAEGDFEEDFLKAHNEYRKRHGVSPLKLDKKLCKYSEEWAKIIAGKNVMEHRKNSPYGENIYCIYSTDPNFIITGNSPVDTWYKEVSKHDFGKEPKDLSTGHFTQVVWKTSELLGVGVAKSRQGYIYVVANYSPAGNFVGHYSENVLPPKKLSSSEENQEGAVSLSYHKSISKSSSEDEENFDRFALDGLKVHNEYRKKHGVPKMKLNDALCLEAKNWAENCAKTSNMAQNPSSSYGENILCIYSSDFSHVPSARDAVKAWYDEIKNHKFGVEAVNHETLRFTQLIWKNSTELGMAMAKNNKGQTYIVANYNPRGNIIGQFNDNVPKSKP